MAPIETTTKEPKVKQGTMWAMQKSAAEPGLKRPPCRPGPQGPEDSMSRTLPRTG